MDKQELLADFYRHLVQYAGYQHRHTGSLITKLNYEIRNNRKYLPQDWIESILYFTFTHFHYDHPEERGYALFADHQHPRNMKPEEQELFLMISSTIVAHYNSIARSELTISDRDVAAILEQKEIVLQAFPSI